MKNSNENQKKKPMDLDKILYLTSSIPYYICPFWIIIRVIHHETFYDIISILFAMQAFENGFRYRCLKSRKILCAAIAWSAACIGVIICYFIL